MDDKRVWECEESLWTCDAAHYHELVDSQCLMVLPEPPYVLSGEQAIEAVSHTPRWSRVEMTHQQIMRPQEGLLVVGYGVTAFRPDGGKGYAAYCTSTYRRLEHAVWRVVQHQQTLPTAALA